MNTNFKHAQQRTGAMETETISKNGASPKSLTSRGNKILLWGILTLMPVISFAQNDDCYFSQETIDYINKGSYYDSLSNASSYGLNYKVEAIKILYRAKENNPRCELILEQLSVWLIECGVLETKYERIDDAIESFELAIKESAALRLLPVNAEVREKAGQRITQAREDIVYLRKKKEQIVKVEKEEILIDIGRKQAEEKLKDTHPFITLGVGYSLMTDAETGAEARTEVNASIYMHPNGLIITGSMGFDKSWYIGGGYSFGFRRYNGHIKFLYGGKGESSLGYMGFGGNFDFIKDILGLNIAVGLGGDLETMVEPSYSLSMGLYVKF